MDPTRILDLASAFWSSAALLTAVDLGLFGALEQGPATAAEIATRTELPPRPAAMLLDAMVALGLCQRDGDRYANTAEAAAFLVPGKRGSLAGALGYNARLFTAWGRLGEAVRADAPIVEAPTYLGRDPERTRAFVEGMHSRALGMGHGLVGAVDLGGRHHLVDVAGGPGTLSVMLCQRHPELRATVLELPGIAAVGRELVAAQGMSERVVHRDADVFTDDLGKGYDAALVSGLLHREPPMTCRDLLARLHRALEPGAVIYLVDVMRDATRVGPPFAALFALNMLLTSERGGCHADVDHVEWLEATGFTDIEIRRPFPPMVHTVVKASRR
jgi:3-hydroxy-5-methyl-1-naphthoate 3-O-methyltransferase